MTKSWNLVNTEANPPRSIRFSVLIVVWCVMLFALAIVVRFVEVPLILFFPSVSMMRSAIENDLTRQPLQLAGSCMSGDRSS